MPIESGTTISDLDQLWPLSGDDINQGDNHVRLIKAVLKAQFPGTAGEGFAEAITATEEELNYLTGLSSNIQEQIDAINSSDVLRAPEGTVMLFAQQAPPAGWTIVNDDNDGLLRFVSDTSGGASGGDDDVLLEWDHLHDTAEHALTGEEVPPVPDHYHYVVNDIKVGDSSSSANPGADQYLADKADGSNAWRYFLKPSSQTPGENKPNTFRTGSVEGAGSAASSHEHGQTSTEELRYNPRYLNVIRATKDAED